MEWTQTYPGLPSMVSAVRAFVRGLLITSPRLDDAELAASELAGNAIRRTSGGRDGGRFSITVSLWPGRARIAVSDHGTGHWSRPCIGEDDVAEYGCGLLVVDGCADKVGHDVSAHGQTVWAEFTWSAGD